jgi:hypothetical protein
MSTTKFIVQRKDALSGRYGSRVGIKAESPEQAIAVSIVSHHRARRQPELVASIATKLVALGGGRYRLDDRYYRVEVAS